MIELFTPNVCTNATITIDGTATIKDFGSTQAYLIYDVIGTSSGTLVFTIAESDPQNPDLEITGGQSASSGVITGPSSGIVALPNISSSALIVSWAVTGSFSGVFVTVTNLIAAPTLNATNLSVSATGSPPPADATYIAGTNGTDLTPLSTDSSGNLNVNVENSVAVTGTFYQTTQPISGTVTVLQSTSSNLNANVSLQATGALSHNLNQDGSGNVGVNVENSVAVTGTFYQTTQPVSGSVTANAGLDLNTSLLALDTSVSGILVAQNSTTAGEVGVLIQGAVTSNAPTYTTAKTSPLSLDTTGSLRVNVTAGGGSNASVGLDNTTAPTSSTLIGMIDAGGNLQGISASNPMPITGSISASNPSVGSNNSTSPTYSTLIGGSDGVDLRPISTDTSGNVNVNIISGGGGGSKITITDANGDGPVNVKPSITPSVTTDSAMVVALSPNSPLPGEYPGVMSEMLLELRRHTVLLRMILGLIDQTQAAVSNNDLDSIVNEDT